ncbi:MAG TPA: cytochrome c3 family protein, partial [Dongiaceae bacterium]
HSGVETDAFAGVPPTHTCMTCHSQIWLNAAMLAPVRESLARSVPIHWQRVNRLPAYVYFDHSIHIAKGVGCSTCHGPVQTMALMRQEAPLTMSWCLSCHRDPTPYLRPPDRVFDMSWTPPADQAAEGDRLLISYLIHTGHLTDCSTCHR